MISIYGGETNKDYQGGQQADQNNQLAQVKHIHNVNERTEGHKTFEEDRMIDSTVEEKF